MTANLTRFNQFIAILGILSLFSPFIQAETGGLSAEHKQWIADNIFANECSSDLQCLTSWNLGEDFPSLGIGHFIWYRQDQQGIFTESFPELMRYYQQQGVAIPFWLSQLPGLKSPWQTREAFYADFPASKLVELREFLAATMPVQVDFIIQRQANALSKLLANAPTSDRDQIAAIFTSMAEENPPYGIFALVDYVNFKGEGVSKSEQYKGQGWGLLQVLTEMLDDAGSEPLIVRFSIAAAEILNRRVQNSPPQRNEQRWLPGWLSRVSRYNPQP